MMTIRFLTTGILALLVSYSTLAQRDCSCEAYAALTKAGATRAAIYKALMKESSVICNAKAVELQGVIAIFEKDNLDSAEYFLKKAEAIYKKTDCGNAVLWNTYKQRFQVYWSRSDFPNAQEYALKFLSSAEAANNIFEQLMAHTMIAVVYYKTNQFDMGLMYIDKSTTLLPFISDIKEKQKALYFIAVRYMSHYMSTESISSLEQSVKYNQEHLALSKQLNDSAQISWSYFNLVHSEDETKNWPRAISLLDSGYLFMDKKDTLELFGYYLNKANILNESNRLHETDQFVDSALFFAKRINHQLGIAETFKLISHIAATKGDYKKALEYTKLEKAIRDSVSNTDRAKAVTELEKKYNQEKNENTIKDLAQKKQLYLFLAIAGLLGSATIALFLRQQSLKHKKNILETEQRLNRARMNPHFFFNALTALQKYALTGADGKQLASNLSRFSHIMRETLESTYKEYITIEQEIQFLTEYLEVQKMRFTQPFTYVISAENIESNEVLIPSMIIQPFLENTLEHGFPNITYTGSIRVTFSINISKELHIEIADNGKGLTTNPLEDQQHISRASQIIKDRIYLLNIKLKTSANFSINNAPEGPGVVVKIHLPLLYKSEY